MSAKAGLEERGCLSCAFRGAQGSFDEVAEFGFLSLRTGWNKRSARVCVCVGGGGVLLRQSSCEGGLMKIPKARS